MLQAQKKYHQEKKPQQKNDKHISFSELKNWEKCSFYHKLTYIDKIRLFKGNEFTVFGNAIHSTCESILLNGKVDSTGFFIQEYRKLLKKLQNENYQFDKKLVLQMKEQATEILPKVIPALDEYFGDYEVLATEEVLMEKTHISEYKFKGFIDLVLKTSDGKYHIIDWKTCSWGWNMRKKSDKMNVYQLIFYKYYYAQKHDINPDDVEVHFGLLKRTGKKDKVELFKVTSGEKRTENAIKLLNKALYNITKENFVKNRLACVNCEFYKTKHCP